MTRERQDARPTTRPPTANSITNAAQLCVQDGLVLRTRSTPCSLGFVAMTDNMHGLAWVSRSLPSFFRPLPTGTHLDRLRCGLATPNSGTSSSLALVHQGFGRD